MSRALLGPPLAGFYSQLVWLCCIIMSRALDVTCKTEEGASFWNPSLTLRAFVTAMTSAFLLNLMTMTAGGGPGAASTFAFGLFSDFGQNESTYTVAEIPFFMLIGNVVSYLNRMPTTLILGQAFVAGSWELCSMIAIES